MYSLINTKISEIEARINIITIDMCRAYGKGIDKLHLIYVKIKEFMIQLSQGLKNISNFEVLLKNNLNRVDVGKNTPIDKDKDKDKDKTISKTRTKNMDKTIPKTKTDDKDMLDEIGNKINNIIDAKKIIIKIKEELKDKIQLIYKIIFKLCNDSRLKQDE